VCHRDDGAILLVRSSPRDDIGPGTWALPGGGIEHGEAPQDALHREFDEETGLTVQITGLREVTADLVPLPHKDAVMHTDRVLYDVRITGGQLRHEVNGTSDRVEWVVPERLAGLPLLPYVARLVGVPAAATGPLPASEPVVQTVLTRRQRFAAYALATDPAGRLLLTRIAAGYPGAGSWHLPGGGTDWGEEPRAGLLRELVGNGISVKVRGTS